MPYTVAVLAADALARAELSVFLAGLELLVLAELTTGDDVEPFQAELDVLIWSVDTFDVLPLGLEVPLLGLVDDAEAAAHALRQGAVGVLSRDVAEELLLEALGALTRGLAVLEPRYLHPAPAEAWPLESLTPREREVLELLAEGLSNKAIAKRLEISEHTVKFHLGALLSKLGATTRTEAVTRAVRAGLLSL